MSENDKTMAVTGLGALSLISLGFMALALMDIGQGIEPDLSLEWTVVRVALLLAVAFHAVALTALWKGRKARK